MPLLKLNYILFLLQVVEIDFAWRHVLRLGIYSNHMRLHFRDIVFLSFIENFFEEKSLCNCTKSNCIKLFLFWSVWSGCGLCLQQRVSEKTSRFCKNKHSLDFKTWFNYPHIKGFCCHVYLNFLITINFQNSLKTKQKKLSPLPVLGSLFQAKGWCRVKVES